MQGMTIASRPRKYPHPWAEWVSLSDERTFRTLSRSGGKILLSSFYFPSQIFATKVKSIGDCILRSKTFT